MHAKTILHGSSYIFRMTYPILFFLWFFFKSFIANGAQIIRWTQGKVLPLFMVWQKQHFEIMWVFLSQSFWFPAFFLLSSFLDLFCCFVHCEFCVSSISPKLNLFLLLQSRKSNRQHHEVVLLMQMLQATLNIVYIGVLLLVLWWYHLISKIFNTNWLWALF